MGIVLLVGLVSAIGAGFACMYAHSRAETHGWDYLRRYGAGVVIWLVAIAPSFIASAVVGLTTIPTAGLLYGMIVLVVSVMGVFTVQSYEPPVAMPEEDDLEAKINRALRK